MLHTKVNEIQNQERDYAEAAAREMDCHAGDVYRKIIA